MLIKIDAILKCDGCGATENIVKEATPVYGGSGQVIRMKGVVFSPPRDWNCEKGKEFCGGCLTAIRRSRKDALGLRQKDVARREVKDGVLQPSTNCTKCGGTMKDLKCLNCGKVQQ